MKRFVLILMLFVPFSIYAQTDAEMAVPLLLDSTNFFICIIAGFLLAMAFQLVLTLLSVAGGITAVGDIEEKGNSSHQKSDSTSSHDDEGMNIGQKISTGAGLWSLITTSIALFFASLLAVKLSMVGANFIGVTLGLVIWAAFYTCMFYLEMKAYSSLLGNLASSLKHGFSSVFSIFSSSKEDMAKEVAKTSAKEQAKAMRKQFEKLFDTHDIDHKIDGYIKKLEPQKVDIHKLKKEIKDLLTHVQVTEKADYKHPDAIKKLILEEADKSKLSEENKKAIKEHVNGLKDIGKKDVSNEEKAKQGIEELTHADRQKIDQYQEKIKKTLQDTQKEELQPEKLEEDIKRILNEPGEASNIVKAKASAMDRQTLIKLVSSAQGVDERKAESEVNKIEGVLQKVSSFFGDTESKASSKTTDVQSRIKNMFSGAGSSLHLDQIYSDSVSLFRGAGEGSDLKYKLEHYNKQELITTISNRTSLTRKEAEPIAEKIVMARDKVLENVNMVETKVNEKMAEAKQKSLAAAEETRKAAVTAAWWIAATAIVSAAASALGGILALEDWIF
ncbi:MAG TPA: hypothetical protein VFI78_04400 [Salinimicrobium sp.]|nr:hypothetical protein [Salinimicrobium sp.]